MALQGSSTTVHSFKLQHQTGLPQTPMQMPLPLGTAFTSDPTMLTATSSISVAGTCAEPTWWCQRTRSVSADGNSPHLMPLLLAGSATRAPPSVLTPPPVSHCNRAAFVKDVDWMWERERQIALQSTLYHVSPNPPLRRKPEKMAPKHGQKSVLFFFFLWGKEFWVRRIITKRYYCLIQFWKRI